MELLALPDLSHSVQSLSWHPIGKLRYASALHAPAHPIRRAFLQSAVGAVPVLVQAAPDECATAEAPF
jgi:hypothetical protein